MLLLIHGLSLNPSFVPVYPPIIRISSPYVSVFQKMEPPLPPPALAFHRDDDGSGRRRPPFWTPKPFDPKLNDNSIKYHNSQVFRELSYNNLSL